MVRRLDDRHTDIVIYFLNRQGDVIIAAEITVTMIIIIILLLIIIIISIGLHGLLRA
jgi:hypothetical protein